MIALAQHTGEVVRVLAVALAALNIGTILGRVRVYARLYRIAVAHRTEDVASIRSVLVFYSGLGVVLIAASWRNLQLLHTPLATPIVMLVFGYAVMLVGLRRMQHEIAGRIQGSTGDLRPR